MVWGGVSSGYVNVVMVWEGEGYVNVVMVWEGVCGDGDAPHRRMR